MAGAFAVALSLTDNICFHSYEVVERSDFPRSFRKELLKKLAEEFRM
jgi:hypothetical protein